MAESPCEQVGFADKYGQNIVTEAYSGNFRWGFLHSATASAEMTLKSDKYITVDKAW